jgi:hypothetical protein
MLTIDKIRERYCPDLTEEELARFREQTRIAKGPPFRVTMEYLRRGNQDENRAAIWMRGCRRMRDGTRA